MKIFPSPEVTALATAIVKGYPAAIGQARIKMMLHSINVEFDDYIVQGATFELTLNDILLNLNQSAGLTALFAKLAEDPRPKVTEAVDAMVAAEVAQRPAGFDLLAKALLIIEGDPLVDHDNLAKNILPSLLNDIDPLRAVVMTGPTDSGKTFSLGLIRRLCRESGQSKKFLPATIDLLTLESTRDCKELAGLVVSWLRLDQFVMPLVDTSDAKIGQRLVKALVIAREQSERTAPTLLVFDHLDKDVSPSIIDFVEEIALAAARGALKDIRVVLIGFPRAPAPFPRGKLISDIVVQPNPALLFKYIDQALDILDRDMDDQALEALVNGVFAGQQQPYPRPFMAELPEKIRGLLQDIMKAPTNG